MKKRKSDDEVIKGSPLNYSAPVAMRYNMELQKLIERMTSQTRRELENLMNGKTANEFFAEDASISSMARILTNKLSEKFDAMFADFAKPIATDFVKNADKSSKATLGASLREMSEGLVLKSSAIHAEFSDLITASIAENVQLIKSIPQEYMNAVQGAVMRSITTGNGLADLVPFLMKRKDMTIKRARLIASDQTRKVTSSLNKARMQKSGMKKFQWLHSSGGQSPRPLHLNVLNGNIYSFDDLPVIDDNTGERGIPGQLINCRCRMIPIIDFGDEDDEE